MTTVYNVMLNETQRRMIELALDARERSALIKNCPTSEELTELNQLVKDMPKNENDNPGHIHGLCL